MALTEDRYEQTMKPFTDAECINDYRNLAHMLRQMAQSSLLSTPRAADLHVAAQHFEKWAADLESK